MCGCCFAQLRALQVKKCASCTNNVGVEKAWACHQCFDRNMVPNSYVLRSDCVGCVRSLVSKGREWACAGVCAKKDLYGSGVCVCVCVRACVCVCVCMYTL
jgi:hypothetical protein